jgi:lipopolysaccharide export system permease protein
MIFTTFFPLRLVSAYICKEFLRFFFLCLASLWVLFLLGDFFDRIDDFIKQAAPVFAIFRYFFFKAPFLMTQIAPAAALAGSLLSLGLLSRHREIIALKACGISIWQIAAPLLLTASFLSVGTWAWNEFVVPYSFHKARQINAEEIKKKPLQSLFNEHGFWYHGDHVFYHIDHFDSRTNTLSGLMIYTLDEQFQVRSLIEVSRASWQGGEWRCDNLQEKSLSFAMSPSTSSCETLLRETPEDFALVAMEGEEFSSQQLRAHIADLQGKGLDTTQYQVDLQLKGAAPLAVLAMALLGFSLAVPGARQLSLPTALGLALITGFGYWVLLALTVSLGQSGTLSPFLAAWSANGAACLLGIFFLLGVD